MHKIAIIGRGPAGLSAFISAKSRNEDPIIFGMPSLAVTKSPMIENFLGFLPLKGEELNKHFEQTALNQGAEFIEKIVTAVYAMGEYFVIQTTDNEMYEAKSVIIATGMTRSKDIKNEEEFLGRGVGYCATCDAPLYRGKKVAIIGYNEKSKEEAEFVAEIAQSVVFVNMTKKDISFDKSNIELINDTPVSFEGDVSCETLKLKNSEIKADGFFVLKDSKKISSLVPSLEIDKNHIKTNKDDMSTSIEGLFAAGDVTGGYYQLMKAVGEGQVAGLSSAKFVKKNK